MDFELLLCDYKTQEEYCNYLKEVLDTILEISSYRKEEDYMALCYYCMTITVLFEGVEQADVIESSLDFKANISAYFQLFNHHQYDALNIIFKLMKSIISRSNCNLLFLKDSNDVILKRVNNKYYSSVLNGYEIEFPFELLGVEIENL